MTAGSYPLTPRLILSAQVNLDLPSDLASVAGGLLFRFGLHHDPHYGLGPRGPDDDPSPIPQGSFGRAHRFPQSLGVVQALAVGHRDVLLDLGEPGHSRDLR